MKPKRIILIRHGESQANIDRYLFGKVPDYTIELTEKGEGASERSGGEIKEIGRARIVVFLCVSFLADAVGL